MTIDDQKDSERRAAAVHEASHMVLVTHFGGLADIHIWPNPSGCFYEKSWLGSCRIFVPPSAGSRPHQPRGVQRARRTPMNWQAIVGLAGCVGELVDDPDIGEGEVVERLYCLESEGVMSATDLQWIGSNLSERSVLQTYDWVCRLWLKIAWEAEILERNARHQYGLHEGRPRVDEARLLTSP